MLFSDCTSKDWTYWYWFFTFFIFTFFNLQRNYECFNLHYLQFSLQNVKITYCCYIYYTSMLCGRLFLSQNCIYHFSLQPSPSPIPPLPPLITRGKLSLFYRQICSFGKWHTRCIEYLARVWEIFSFLEWKNLLILMLIQLQLSNIWVN